MTSPETDRSGDRRSDEQLGQRARALYRQACRHLDPATAGRLRAIRRQALESTRAPRHHGVRWLVPGGAFAVIALATLMIWQPLSHHATTPASQASGPESSGDLDNDLPPDADKTDPNLYQNLDFYGWLAASGKQPAAAH